MFGLSALSPFRLYAGLGTMAVVLLVLSGCYATGRHDGKVAEHKRSVVALAKLQSAWDVEKAAQLKAAQTQRTAQTAITSDVGAKAERAQIVIQTRYRTLVQKVTTYVPPAADAVVPAGLVQLLDAAARGDDPDAVSVTTGNTFERSAQTKLSTLAGVVVGNYGVANSNRQTLIDLQTWVRQQEAAGK